MTLVAGAVVPLTLLLALGFVLRRRRFVSDEVWRGLDRLTYWVFFPSLLFVATACYAVYAAYLRRAPEGLSTGALMTVMFGLAAVYMLPLWLIEIYAFDRPLPLGFTSLWSIAYMAVFPSLLAQTFWASGVAQVGPGRAGYFIYLSPVFGVLLAIGLLGEVFRWYHAAGIVLIFAGLWLANSARRAPAAAEPEK